MYMRCSNTSHPQPPVQVSSPPSPVTLWTIKQLIPQLSSHNVHPRRLRILIKHLSNEADYHIYPTHPSCPTNGHKNRGRIPAPALTTTFRLSQAVFLLLPQYVSQSLYEKLSKGPPSPEREPLDARWYTGLLLINQHMGQMFTPQRGLY